MKAKQLTVLLNQTHELLRGITADLVKIYFHDELTDDFIRVNDGDYLRVEFPTKDRGYIFARNSEDEARLNRDHEEKMERELARQRSLGRAIKGKFVDHLVSGFYWENKR